MIYICNVIIVIVISMTSCQSVNEILLIVPNNHKGVIKILENENGDESSINVNVDGIGETRNIDHFKKWYKLRARYINGTLIRNMNDGATGGLAIWPLPAPIGKNEVLFFIGTDTEWEAEKKKSYP